MGGSVAGIQASLDLANSGFKVYLVESGLTPFGKIVDLECLMCKVCHRYFPKTEWHENMDCGNCYLPAMLENVRWNKNIEVLTLSQITNVEKNGENFVVKLSKYPRYVDEKKCTSCGLCSEKCPVILSPLRKAIYLPFYQAIPLAYVIDMNSCNRCGKCTEVCKADAVMLEEKEQIIQLTVGSIILSPGFDEFNPKSKREYGYGVYPNVVSSREFERTLSASGLHGGTVIRPSDGKVPKKVAFIQCVGSRDARVGNNYCSAVCCMYATKEAVIAQEHAPGLKATIFFMDMRAYGKEFDYYYKRAKEEHGINYVRCRVASLEETANNNLKIRYESEDGTLREEEFEMVVLSVGLCAPEDAQKLARKAGIKLNKYGFCETSTFEPIETNIEGIFVSGAFSSPKDIPDTVAQASGAAAKASALISSERNKLVTKKEYPPEIGVDAEPRIGVFICQCGINIGGVVNVPEVVEYAKTLPNVIYADHNLYTCSQDTQKKIKETIKEHNLNRVIVASCTPRTHEPLFRETIREAGLNPYLFEMTNIRDQCSWVHMREPEKATKKAKDLVRMAIAKARLHKRLQPITAPVNRTCLVIGGGLAGMISALNLAEQGIETYLIEKEGELGGNLKHIHYLANGENPQAKLAELIKKVESNNKIHIKTNSKIKSVEGFVGNFKTFITSGEIEEEIKHGCVIIATGAVEYKPTEYNYGRDKRIVTQRELEELIWNKKLNASTVVMIQCVGSRDEEHGYCSRVCCYEAIKNALKIKEIKPDTEIYILYRDIRTYGFKEDYYRKASERGVIFIRYEEEHKPCVDIGNKINVKIDDLILKKKLSINADLLVLSAAIRPNPDNEEIGKIFKIALSKDKFFLEAHMKLRPVEFATDGIFLCGLAHGPKFIEECISQAYGATSRAMTVLSKDTLEIEPFVSTVVDENCDGCAYCVEPCPYGAITLIEYMYKDAVKKTVQINETLCKGCGVCQATCPKNGVYVAGFRLEQLSAMVDAVVG